MEDGDTQLNCYAVKIVFSFELAMEKIQLRACAKSLQSARSRLLLRKLRFLKRTLSDGATGVGIGACRSGHARGYFESCVLISRRLDARRHVTCSQTLPCVDVRIAYSTMTKNAFRNCASNAA